MPAVNPSSLSFNQCPANNFIEQTAADTATTPRNDGRQKAAPAHSDLTRDIPLAGGMAAAAYTFLGPTGVAGVIVTLSTAGLVAYKWATQAGHPGEPAEQKSPAPQSPDSSNQAALKKDSVDKNFPTYIISSSGSGGSLLFSDSGRLDASINTMLEQQLQARSDTSSEIIDSVQDISNVNNRHMASPERVAELRQEMAALLKKEAKQSNYLYLKPSHRE